MNNIVHIITLEDTALSSLNTILQSLVDDQNALGNRIISTEFSEMSFEDDGDRKVRVLSVIARPNASESPIYGKAYVLHQLAGETEFQAVIENMRLNKIVPQCMAFSDLSFDKIGSVESDPVRCFVIIGQTQEINGSIVPIELNNCQSVRFVDEGCHGNPSGTITLTWELDPNDTRVDIVLPNYVAILKQRWGTRTEPPFDATHPAEEMLDCILFGFAAGTVEVGVNYGILEGQYYGFRIFGIQTLTDPLDALDSLGEDSRIILATSGA